MTLLMRWRSPSHTCIPVETDTVVVGNGFAVGASFVVEMDQHDRDPAR